MLENHTLNRFNLQSGSIINPNNPYLHSASVNYIKNNTTDRL